MGNTADNRRCQKDDKRCLANGVAPEPVANRNLKAQTDRDLALKNRNSKEHKKALKTLVKHHKAKMAEMQGADAKGFNYLLIYVDKDDKYKPKKDNKKKDDQKQTISTKFWR